MSIVLDGTSGITTPEIVSTGGPLVATLTAAIQEQQAIIESLTARVVALEQA